MNIHVCLSVIDSQLTFTTFKSYLLQTTENKHLTCEIAETMDFPKQLCCIREREL